MVYQFNLHVNDELLWRLLSLHSYLIICGIARKYMHKGVSIWLDVPVEALAQRITAVGTNSRPLLHSEVGDAYTKVVINMNLITKWSNWDQY